MTFDLNKPLDLSAPYFVNNKFAVLEQIREERPVHTAKVSVLKVYTVARYEDCTALMKDPRVCRNKSNATGGSRFPIPLPNSVKPLVASMIQEDDPNHKRLRNLVRHAFKPQAIAPLESSIDAYSLELLDQIEHKSSFDLNRDYALKIPVRVIADMLGVDREDMPVFQKSVSLLTEGFSGWRVLRSLFRDLPRTVTFVRELIEKKRAKPADDVLTGLIEAEEEGDRLSEDEIVGMVFLLIIAGFETTVHLICNGVHTLLEHQDAMQELRDTPALIDSAVEEILRHRGPVQSTKPNWTAEDICLHGVTIPKGKPVMPLFGAANHDPRVFEQPDTFDINRSPNHHLGFSHGVHFCLGAHLARSEAKLGILNLIQRFPNLRLAVPGDQLTLSAMPGWHRYERMPLATR